MRKSAFSRGSLLAAASLIGLVSVPAMAQEAPTGVEDSPSIITIDGVSHLQTVADGGSLDSGITGVGQMSVSASPTTTGFTSCTGTLINPRTVIFAAHCVNTRPMEAYGANGIAFGAHAAGTPIAFGFEANNLPAIRQWFGLASTGGGTDANPALRFHTNLARSLYAAEQVWYDSRSLNPGSSGFLMGDVAMATLDTPAFDIPSWVMLFSPLDGPTASTIIGYGVANTATAAAGLPCPTGPTDACNPIAGSDFRRRTAENMISLLGSLDDRNQWLFGVGGTVNNVYMQSFSSPLDEDGNPTDQYDFGLFGGPSRGDGPLAREGITGSGDSGGPLVVTQDGQQVVVGVLSGGSRFFGDQRFSTYGTHNFYQPLHAYWQAIVANNPYVYAGNQAGDGNWEDASHWVQLMDPNYAILAEGSLVNSLPNTPEEGVTGSGAKFGYICFLEECTELDQAAAAGAGDYLLVAGGPGSTNFVPNNIVANPSQGIKSRYYDVTLSAAGTTTLGSSATVDRMTLDGQTKLAIGNAGSLTVLGEYNQIQGWTDVNGTLRSNRDMLILTGLLSGSGTVAAPYLTVVGGIVAPGGNGLGNLNVQGDMILASESLLNISVAPEFSDKLLVSANAAAGTSGLLALDGGTVLFTRAQGIQAPKYGGTWIIASAAGGVDGTFGLASAGPGVVKVRLTYGANDVTASLSASSFSTVLVNPTGSQLAFANALDLLRGSNSTALWGLYSNIDWVDGTQVAATFDALTPRIVGDVGALHDRQSKLLLTSVGDRLSLLALGKAEGLTMAGNLTAAFQARSEGLQSGSLGFGASQSGGVTVAKLPGRMTGFMSGGVDRTRSSYGGDQLEASQGGWHMAMGLEMPLGDNGAFGTAAGFAEGESSPGGDHDRSRTTMAAAYAAMPLGDGFYVGGLVSAESSRAALDRTSTDGNVMMRLSGATTATRYSALAEAGFETGLVKGLTLTPRAQLGYSHYSLGGFTEEGGELALKLSDVNVSRVEARLGAKLEGKTRFAGIAIVPQISADYVSLLAGRKTGATVRFALAPEEAIHLPLASTDSGWAEIKGGVTFGDGPLTLGLSGQHATGGAMADQRAQADIRFRF